MRVDVADGARGGVDLRPAQRIGRVRDLALQVGKVDVIVVDDAERADAGGGEIEQRRRAQAAGADHQHARGPQFRLPLLADLVQDQVAGVAVELGFGEIVMRHRVESSETFQEWLVGMPAETTLAVTSMIFGGIFDKFPKLRVLFSHAGGSFPFTFGRISHGWHARQDLCNINHIKDPKSYIGKFWIDGITHDDDAFRYLLSIFGADKICYGTDYPFPLGDLNHGEFLEKMSIPQHIKNQIFSQSAMEFLGIALPATS